MSVLEDLRRLRADMTAAPWMHLGQKEDGAHLVVSEGAKNGHAPLVAMCPSHMDAIAISKTPELVDMLISFLEADAMLRGGEGPGRDGGRG